MPKGSTRPVLADEQRAEREAAIIARVVAAAGELTPADCAELRALLPPAAPDGLRLIEIPERYCLYRYFDAEGVLLYVGISDEPDKRDGGHRRTSPWYQFVGSLEVIEIGPVRKARLAEISAIDSEAPVFNKLRKGRAEAAERLAAYLAARVQPVTPVLGVGVVKGGGAHGHQGTPLGVGQAGPVRDGSLDEPAARKIAALCRNG